MKSEKTTVFIDGICHENLGPGAMGVLIAYSASDIVTFGGREDGVTKPRMDVMAASVALQKIDRFPNRRIEVFSDSAYVVNSIRNGWFQKWDLLNPRCAHAHPDLWIRIQAHLRRFPNLEFFHLKGLVDLKNNGEVDEWHEKFNFKHDRNISRNAFRRLVKMNHRVHRVSLKKLTGGG